VKKLSAKSFNIKSTLQKAALIIGIGILLNAAAIYFLICPLRSRVKDSEVGMHEITSNLDKVRSIISTTNDKQQKIANLKKEYAELIAKGVLTPLLNSYAMRAKTLLQPLATQSGLVLEDVRELPPIPLQQPCPIKGAVHWCRQPIEFSASGSYTQLSTFISHVESELPLAILSSLEVSTQHNLPEIHKILISFEWPTRTELTP